MGADGHTSGTAARGAAAGAPKIREKLRPQVGVKQVDERIWLVTFMHYDLGYFDDETCRLEPIQNPFGATVLPMSSE